MYSAELAQVSNLYCSAAVETFCGISLSATGLGNSLQEAEARREAEFAEGKAQILGPRGPTVEFFKKLRSEAEGDPDWGELLDEISPPGTPLTCETLECFRARDISSGAERFLPTAFLGSEGSQAPVAIGIAAGTNLDMALFNALLEAIERYSSLNWWSGCHTAAAPSPAAERCFSDQQRYWIRKATRRTGLLDITPHFGIPVYVAWSCGHGGRDLCFGTACRPNDQAAVRAALKELFQMEFGLDVIRYRQRHGVKLDRKERVMLARAFRLSVENCSALLTPARAVNPAAPSASMETSTRIAAHLSRFDKQCYAIDFERPDEVHWVVKVLSPNLRISSACRKGDGQVSPIERRAENEAPWRRWDLY
ncbi:YcaO-like family protein [Pelagibius sp. Alg239-R121]|uniref:YcaO-like family protein n=1 Tax=Pelagibius sp. Alg239-R121 TaxID=2993448 RepID=UPI0024A6B1E3|nr:YcaO-like family protein [Pelagibius sp. Alg239-R121]